MTWKPPRGSHCGERRTRHGRSGTQHGRLPGQPRSERIPPPPHCPPFSLTFNHGLVQTLGGGSNPLQPLLSVLGRVDLPPCGLRVAWAWGEEEWPDGAIERYLGERCTQSASAGVGVHQSHYNLKEFGFRVQQNSCLFRCGDDTETARPRHHRPRHAAGGGPARRPGSPAGGVGGGGGGGGGRPAAQGGAGGGGRRPAGAAAPRAGDETPTGDVK